MFFRLIFLVTVLLLIYYGYNNFKRQTPENRKNLLWKYAVYGLILTIIGLVVTGRLHWLGGLIAALIPIARQFGPLALRWLPGTTWFQQSRFANPVITTRFLRMSFDLRTGVMSGEILAGTFQGRTLDSLSPQELNELKSQYEQQDKESARLLNAYILRHFKQAGDNGRHSSSNNRSSNNRSSNNGSSASGSMGRQEALQILGLQDNASERDIIQAHRRLMQKVHPDRGGSDYLAAKINQAKDFLLKT